MLSEEEGYIHTFPQRMQTWQDRLGLEFIVPITVALIAPFIAYLNKDMYLRSEVLSWKYIGKANDS